MLSLLLLIVAACSSPETEPNNGWREIAPPRSDLQCWVRWNQGGSAVCAPSLTSTHGASL